ncbi:hypothetical protein M2444_004340 [Paenibacillus sp. PastF-3]|uniref:hypothetical protein n=1 Tax=Paenibacillus sp. PastF-3 TaxID=2940626 RepID=UPI002475E5BC|nr:hypothetical protein [Paenibacillus sp. PastF-3]MDH6372527.1 hypothetical protein [Paenibacillus sp. PastF-3]
MKNKDIIINRVKKLDEKFLGSLEEIAEKFEVQHDKFIQDTDGENFLQIILRAHLYIEYEMKELIKIRLMHPGELGDQLKFSSMFRILLATGIIPLELKAPINCINKFRNNYAHNLNYQFNEEEFDKLVNTFSEEFKVDFLRKYSNEDLSVKLKEILIRQWLILIELRLLDNVIGRELEDIFS